MTSAQNHRQRLSGSDAWRVVLLVVFLLGVGCSTAKKTQKTPERSDSDDKTEVPQVYNPVTGKYEPVEDPGKLVDTIQFREDKSKEPVGTVDRTTDEKKDVYEVAYLIPFDVPYASFADGIDPKLRRFLHYYSGVKLGLEELNDRGIAINAHVYDSRESASETRKILDAIKRPDAIVGPYEMESLKIAAEYAAKKNVPVFSPWTPSIPLDNDSPYFVQLNPGLEAHAEAISDYIDTRMPAAKVYMVARNDAREKSRLTLFSDAHRQNDGSAEPYEELVIEDESVSLSNTPLKPLLSEDRATVFILPLYSRNDEDFISSFLRKLHGDMGESEVYVFGMPQWTSFGKLVPDYMESANVHVSSAHHVEYTASHVREFQKKFLETFGTVPEPAAYQGYDFTLYLGEALWRHGTGFLDDMSSPGGITADFRIEPVYRSGDTELRQRAHFYENRAVHILRFTGHSFRKME